MLKRLRAIFEKLKVYFGKDNEARDITLLIIGPASSGKTALIYFIYQYVAMRRSKKTLKSNLHNRTESSSLVSGAISQVDLSDFIRQVKLEMPTNKDFVGTNPNSINYIHYDAGAFKLKIFNIAGETFNWTVQGRERESVLKSLAGHLENEEITNVYTILAEECIANVPEKQKKTEIDFTTVVQLFDKSIFPNTFDIFTNILNNVNTIRVVTKFDRLFKPPMEAITGKHKHHSFAIMKRALYMLNDNQEYYQQHINSFDLNNDSFFNGSRNKQYVKRFLCTGMYDVNNSLSDLYELEDILDGNGEKATRFILKFTYRDPKNGGAMSRLRMYGIEEIFIYIQHNGKNMPSKTNISHADSDEEALTIADYKKILEVK